MTDKMNRPICLFSDIVRLVPSSIEHGWQCILLSANPEDGKTISTNIPFFPWKKSLYEKGLILDLTNVGWVDVNTLVRLVLMVEAVRRDGIDVVVIMPSIQESKDDKKNANAMRTKISQLVENRIKVVSFLEYLKFRRALGCNHLNPSAGNLFIQNEVDVDSIGSIKELSAYSKYTNETEKKNDPRYTNIFPLKWITPADDSSLLVNFLSSVLARAETRISAIDARSISDVILFELVENVREHAKITKNTLVCAAAFPETFIRHGTDFPKMQGEYFSWLNKFKIASVNLVVGDSGIGIPYGLEKSFEDAKKAGEAVPDTASTREANIMLWAFDRWSTSKPRDLLRGTRGLYRVERIVQRYKGMITLRCGSEQVGIRHNANVSEKKFQEDQRMYRIPGTTVEAFFPSLREHNKIWQIPVSEKEKNTEFRYVRIKEIASGGLKNQDRIDIVNALVSGEPRESIGVIVIVEDENLDKHDQSGLEELLRQLVEIRHPGLLILCGFNKHWDSIEGKVDALNQELTRNAKDKLSVDLKEYSVWNPILVIGNEDHYAWCGVNTDIKLLMDKLVENTEGLTDKALRDLFKTDDIMTEAQLFVHGDRGLFKRDDEGKLYLRIHPAEIITYVRNRLLDELNIELSKANKNEAFRTPSLRLVRKWFDVEDLVEKTIGARLVGLVLAALIQNWAFRNKRGLQPILFADPMTSPNHYKNCAEFLSIENRQQMDSETVISGPLKNQIFKIGQEVIVYCDIISATEAVSACVKQVLQEHAVPLCIITLIDAREIPGPKIEIWGREIEIIALANIDLKPMIAEGELKVIDIGAVSKRPESPNEYEELKVPPISAQALNELILENDSLKLTHIRRPIGRHFTFYLQAEKIVDSALIKNAIKKEIQEWLHCDDFQGLEDNIPVYHPFPEPKASKPGQRMAHYLSTLDTRFKPVPLKRESAYGNWLFASVRNDAYISDKVVLVDWGAVTGRSIIQMIQAFAKEGVEKIFVCICLDELPIYESELLKSLLFLRNKGKLYTSASQQPSLFNVDNAPNDKVIDDKTEIGVSFIARFPIGVYTPYECPICRRITYYSEIDAKSKCTRDFIDSRKEYLRPPPEENNPESRSFSQKDYFLRGQDAIDAFSFRLKLANALVSTKIRNEIFEEIKIRSKEVEAKNPDAIRYAIAIIKFLYFESQWLHKAPLRFDRLRSEFAKICLVIITTSSDDESILCSISLLRVVGKTIFLRHINFIFDAVSQREEPLLQLLFDIHSFLSKPYHKVPKLLKSLDAQLKELIDKIRVQNIDVKREILEEFEELHYRTETSYLTLDTKGLDERKALRKIEEALDLYTKAEAHGLRKDICLIVSGPFEKVIETALKLEPLSSKEQLYDLPIAAREYLNNLYNRWIITCRFIDIHILPPLKVLREILESFDLGRRLTQDVCKTLIEWSNSDGYLLDLEISQLIKGVSSEVESLTPNGWAEISYETNWIWENLLEYHGEQSNKKSNFIQVFKNMHHTLGNFLNSFTQNSGRRTGMKIDIDNGLVEANPDIICEEFLLIDLFNQIVDNALQNRSDHHKEIELKILINPNDVGLKNGRVSLIIKNNNSQPKTVPPRYSGIHEFQRRIKPFGATIDPVFPPEDPSMTFEVNLSFKLY